MQSSVISVSSVVRMRSNGRRELVQRHLLFPAVILSILFSPVLLLLLLLLLLWLLLLLLLLPLPLPLAASIAVLSSPSAPELE